MDPYAYMVGFGNSHCSTAPATPHALPVGQNSPQIAPYGLYAEQISGTAFTAPRALNARTWCYRVRPSVCHQPFTRVAMSETLVTDFTKCIPTPNQLRWSAPKFPAASDSNPTAIAFYDSWTTYAGSGSPLENDGLAIHMYVANADMPATSSMYNSDGEILIVPQEGALDIRTELGYLYVRPNEICVIPRGIVFQVRLPDKRARGYILEVYSGRFELPELGPIGANGLANARDFKYPVACFDAEGDIGTEHLMYNKYMGNLWVAKKSSSPFNVAGWHGNYAPYKYDLATFNTVNTVSFDHLDPSIFTVLTCRSSYVPAGTALADFVIFPPRWACADHTFRPPYFHRNNMTEFMGLICGSYEAKSAGFEPGGASLHSKMSAHGPDHKAFIGASNAAKLAPVRVADGTMAFMFETSRMLAVTPRVMEAESGLQSDYWTHWDALRSNFVAGQAVAKGPMT